MVGGSPDPSICSTMGRRRLWRANLHRIGTLHIEQGNEKEVRASQRPAQRF